MSSSLIVPKMNNDNHPEIVAIIKKAEIEINKIKEKMEKDVENKNKEINDKAEIKALEDVIKEKGERLASLKKNMTPPPMTKSFADIIKDQNDNVKPIKPVVDKHIKPVVDNRPIKHSKPVKTGVFQRENNPASTKFINQLCRGHNDKNKCNRCHSIDELIEQATDMDTIVFMIIGMAKSNITIKYQSGDYTKTQKEFFNIQAEFIDFAKYKLKEYNLDETDLGNAFDLITSGDHYEYKNGRELVRKIMGYKMVSVSN